MKWRALLCGLVVGACLVAAGAPGASGSGCGPDYESGLAQYDTDGDGLVCVDQSSGAVTDDQAASPGVVDRNGDSIICVKQTGSGSIITTDNNANNPENANCPPAFQPSPLG